jgi:hypothetical protein
MLASFTLLIPHCCPQHYSDRSPSTLTRLDSLSTARGGPASSASGAKRQVPLSPSKLLSLPYGRHKVLCPRSKSSSLKAEPDWGAGQPGCMAAGGKVLSMTNTEHMRMGSTYIRISYTCFGKYVTGLGGRMDRSRSSVAKADVLEQSFVI